MCVCVCGNKRVGMEEAGFQAETISQKIFTIMDCLNGKEKEK